MVLPSIVAEAHRLFQSISPALDPGIFVLVDEDVSTLDKLGSLIGLCLINTAAVAKPTRGGSILAKPFSFVLHILKGSWELL